MAANACFTSANIASADSPEAMVLEVKQVFAAIDAMRPTIPLPQALTEPDLHQGS